MTLEYQHLRPKQPDHNQRQQLYCAAQCHQTPLRKTGILPPDHCKTHIIQENSPKPSWLVASLNKSASMIWLRVYSSSHLQMHSHAHLVTVAKQWPDDYDLAVQQTFTQSVYLISKILSLVVSSPSLAPWLRLRLFVCPHRRGPPVSITTNDFHHFPSAFSSSLLHHTMLSLWACLQLRTVDNKPFKSFPCLCSFIFSSRSRSRGWLTFRFFPMVDQKGLF